MSVLKVVGVLCLTVLAGVSMSGGATVTGQGEPIEYLLLATNKTSTMQRELGEGATKGYRFKAVMGGNTAFGGSETVTVMQRDPADYAPGRFQYRLLATSKTSTMQKELQAAGDEGYQYCGQTVFETAFGGKEVVVILELDTQTRSPHFEYLLLATKKTSTMQKEISQAGDRGFELVGLTVGETAFGGAELVSILRRAPNP